MSTQGSGVAGEQHVPILDSSTFSDPTWPKRVSCSFVIFNRRYMAHPRKLCRLVISIDFHFAASHSLSSNKESPGEIFLGRLKKY